MGRDAEPFFNGQTKKGSLICISPSELGNPILVKQS